MSREAPQVLLLDEPTNHLDVDSREALVQALNSYPGAVVLVSHDPHLIGLVADRLWLVADGGIAPFDGDLDDYRRHLQEQRRAERSKGRAAKVDSASAPTVSRKDKRRAGAQARAAAVHLRKTAKEAETRIAKLDRKKAALEARLTDPEVYQGPTAALQALQVEHGEIKQALTAAEEAWLDAQSAIEAAVKEA